MGRSTELIAGVLDPCAVQVLAGERETLERFVRTCRIATVDPERDAAE